MIIRRCWWRLWNWEQCTVKWWWEETAECEAQGWDQIFESINFFNVLRYGLFDWRWMNRQGGRVKSLLCLSELSTEFLEMVEFRSEDCTQRADRQSKKMQHGSQRNLEHWSLSDLEALPVFLGKLEKWTRGGYIKEKNLGRKTMEINRLSLDKSKEVTTRRSPIRAKESHEFDSQAQ